MSRSAVTRRGGDDTHRGAEGPQIARKGRWRGYGAGEGRGGVSKLSGVGEGRGLGDLEQKTSFRFFDNLYT